MERKSLSYHFFKVTIRLVLIGICLSFLHFIYIASPIMVYEGIVFLRKGIITHGIIIQKKKEEISFFRKQLLSSEDNFIIHYSFNVNQTAINDIAYIDKETWDLTKKGDQIKIIYLPNDPTRYYLYEDRLLFFSPYLFFMFFCCIGVVVPIFFTLNFFKNKKLNDIKNDFQSGLLPSDIKMKKFGGLIMAFGAFLFLIGLTDCFDLRSHKDTTLIYVGTIFGLAGIAVIVFDMYIKTKEKSEDRQNK